MDTDRAVEFAAARNRGVLITLKRDGRPQASNIAYAIWDGEVHISVTDDRVKTANLRRDPRASLHVTSSDFWKWVVLEGEARLSAVTTDAEDEAATLLRRTYEAISGPHPDWADFNRAMIEDHRLVVSLPIDHAYGQV